MFLASLTFEQRKVFLGLAKQILIADDGLIDSQEESYLRSLCSEMSLSFTDELSVEKSKVKDFFCEKESKKILLLELVALSYSNNDYHKKQNEFTDQISHLIGVSIIDLREIEALISKFYQAQNKLIEFIES